MAKSRRGSHQGLTYLLVSGRNRNEVHVVETYHVDDPHLLVVERRYMVKLARGRAETWAGEAAPGAPTLTAEALGPGRDLVMEPSMTTNY